MIQQLVWLLCAATCATEQVPPALPQAGAGAGAGVGVGTGVGVGVGVGAGEVGDGTDPPPVVRDAVGLVVAVDEPPVAAGLDPGVVAGAPG
jgi:hypothetical protein